MSGCDWASLCWTTCFLNNIFRFSTPAFPASEKCKITHSTQGIDQERRKSSYANGNGYQDSQLPFYGQVIIYIKNAGWTPKEAHSLKRLARLSKRGWVFPLNLLGFKALPYMRQWQVARHIGAEVRRIAVTIRSCCQRLVRYQFSAQYQVSENGPGYALYSRENNINNTSDSP